jgi:hypothetical protein
MSIVARFTPNGLTAEKYNESLRRLEAAGVIPAVGMTYHICYGTDGNLRVSEVWDSRAQFEAFGEKLMPILVDVGIDVGGPPEISEVQNVMTP